MDGRLVRVPNPDKITGSRTEAETEATVLRGATNLSRNVCEAANGKNGGTRMKETMRAELTTTGRRNRPMVAATVTTAAVAVILVPVGGTVSPKQKNGVNWKNVSPFREDSGPTQPPMMSFKAFLAAHDDSISDEEAVKKYAEYKLEFRRQQLNEFFTAHKDEEWFKLKYHPEEHAKRKNEQLTGLKRRMEVFCQLLAEGKLEGLSLDADNAEKLVKLLDTVVIKLEGGTDEDLKILDTPRGPEDHYGSAAPVKEKPSKAAEDKPKANEEPKDTEDEQEKAGESLEANEGEIKSPAGEEGENDPEEGEREGEEGEEDEYAKKARELLNKEPKAPEENASRKRKASDEFESDAESDKEGPPGFQETDKERSMTEDVSQDALEKKEGWDKEEKKDKDDEKDNKPLARELHRTSSIFLRNLAPTITKQEVEAMCKRYPGFLRAAIADPQPERRWFRRGWVTFERNVNIKEICWNLNNIRLRDTELGAIVNRDLSRRIRTVNGITCHKNVVRNDIRLAARIVQNLDSRWGLWEETAQESTEVTNGQGSSQPFGVFSRNPVLHNITDYLIEEASAEEEELLGSTGMEEGEEGEGGALMRDDDLARVLDRLLLYLRVVHSVDYYNHSEYPNEDEMPNRCGILHVRGIPPASRVSQQEISDYCALFESKIASFMQPIPRLTEEEANKLGLKDTKSEVEKFIAANTQELAKDKWLCPLSGKKFKGPDFIRKHILSKHAEKLEEVKRDVEYFNQYLRDPKRPQLPEHPGNKTGSQGGASSGSARSSHMPDPRPDYPPQSAYGASGYSPRSYAPYGGPPSAHAYSGGGRDYGRSRGGGKGRGAGVDVVLAERFLTVRTKFLQPLVESYEIFITLFS
nr:EOG090X04A7 [Triops cancriformis]